MTSEQYLEQIAKQLRERGLDDAQARIILDTARGYGQARYVDGYTDCQLQRGRAGESR